MNGRVIGKCKVAVKQGLWLLFALIVNYYPAWAAESVSGRVSQVINAKSFLLEDGKTVRLASLQAPNVEDKRGRPGEPLGEVARAKLRQLIQGQQVRLEVESTDRHGHLVAQVYDTTQNRWIQEEMLGSGMAMVYSLFPDGKAKLPDMLAKEREARTGKRGLWNHPYFQIITPEGAVKHLNRFKLVEGRVRQISDKGGRIFLNFGDDWKTDFSCLISRGDRRAFKQMDLKALEGKVIRVRGWVYSYNGPMIDLKWPGQLEIIE